MAGVGGGEAAARQAVAARRRDAFHQHRRASRAGSRAHRASRETGRARQCRRLDRLRFRARYLHAPDASVDSMGEIAVAGRGRTPRDQGIMDVTSCEGQTMEMKIFRGTNSLEIAKMETAMNDWLKTLPPGATVHHTGTGYCSLDG